MLQFCPPKVVLYLKEAFFITKRRIFFLVWLSYTMWWLWLLVILDDVTTQQEPAHLRHCSPWCSLESSNNNVMILKAESTSDLKMTSSTRKNWYEVDNRHPLCNWVNDALCSAMRNFVWSSIFGASLEDEILLLKFPQPKFPQHLWFGG